MLTSEDVDYIRECLADVAGDVEAPITYRTFTGREAGDAALGVPDELTFEDEETTACVRELSLQQVALAGGRYELGDIEATIRRGTAPAYGDRLAWGGREFEVAEVREVRLGAVVAWRVRCKRL